MFEENPAAQGMGWDEKSKSDHGASGIKNGLSTDDGVGITSRIKSGIFCLVDWELLFAALTVIGCSN